MHIHDTAVKKKGASVSEYCEADCEVSFLSTRATRARRNTGEISLAVCSHSSVAVPVPFGDRMLSVLEGFFNLTRQTKLFLAVFPSQSRFQHVLLQSFRG